MALPTFEYDRRIDIVDALNELSTAADAAIEAGGGSSSYVLPVAADAVLGGVKGQRVEENDGIDVTGGVISAAAAVTDQHINDLINARLKTVLATATVGADGTMTFTV